MLHCTKGIISRSLIDSYIGHDNFLLVYGVLKRYDYMNEVNNLKTSKVN